MFKSSKQMENSGGRVGNPTWMCICIYPKHIYIYYAYNIQTAPSTIFIHEIFISTKLSARRAPSTRFPPPGCSWWCSDLAPWSSGSHWSLEGNLFSKRSSQKKTHTKKTWHCGEFCWHKRLRCWTLKFSHQTNPTNQYIFLEPVCPLLAPSPLQKKGVFQSKQGSFGFQVYIEYRSACSEDVFKQMRQICNLLVWM